MISRSLLVLGLGVALSFGAPAYVLAQTQPQSAAASTQTQKPVVKKISAKKKAASKKQVAGKKTPAKGEATAKKAKASAKPKAKEAAEKPKGFFASLFGGSKANEDKSAKAKAETKAKARPIVAEKAAERPSLLARLQGQPKEEAIPTGRIRPLNPITPPQPVALSAGQQEVIAAGNNGELRSGDPQTGGLMTSLFGVEEQYLPETRALDGAMRARSSKKKGFQVAEKWQPQEVEFSGYPRGTIVIDTDNHFLYLVQNSGSARRYGIAVGKDGLKYKGSVKVGDKQEWPRWIPTKEMQEREPKKYGQYKDGMPGGGQNPLGARAIYLYEGKKDTHLRIHGTIAPQSIGTDSSNGCFRMVNDHVIDLYRRVPVGANVVVM